MQVRNLLFLSGDKRRTPLAGALIYVYAAGGTFSALAPIFDASANPIANPIQADAYGRAAITVADGKYDLKITLGSLSITQLNQQWGDVVSSAASAVASAAAAATSAANALAAANATGPLTTFATKALANAGLAGIAANAWIEVEADESAAAPFTGSRVRYQKLSGAYANAIDMDQLRADVASATEGVGVDLVSGAIKYVSSPAAARVLTAATRATTLFVTSADGGIFRRDPSDTASAEDGGAFCGTVIRDTRFATAGVWKRVYTGLPDVAWFGASPSLTDNSPPFSAALAVYNAVQAGAGTFSYGTTLGLIGKSMRGRARTQTGLNYTGNGVAVAASGTTRTPPSLEHLTLTGTASATAGLKLSLAGTGCNSGSFRNLFISGFTGVGAWGVDCVGSLNNGCYYNVFENVESTLNWGGFRGYSSDGAANGNRCNQNTFIACKAISNTSDGFFFNYANGNALIACGREVNGGFGINSDHANLSVSGGYSENNASGAINKTLNGICMYSAGQTVDALVWQATPGDIVQSTNWSMDPAGNLVCNGTLKAFGGIGLSNATPSSQTINGVGPMFFAASGTNLVELNNTIADGNTTLLLRRNVGGTQTLQQVSMGIADSGGVGFKLLRVPN